MAIIVLHWIIQSWYSTVDGWAVTFGTVGTGQATACPCLSSLFRDITNEAVVVIFRPVADPREMGQQCGDGVVGLDSRDMFSTGTKYNDPPVNSQCTNHRIAIWWFVALRFYCGDQIVNFVVARIFYATLCIRTAHDTLSNSNLLTSTVF